MIKNKQLVEMLLPTDALSQVTLNNLPDCPLVNSVVILIIISNHQGKRKLVRKIGRFENIEGLKNQDSSVNCW